MAEAAVFMDILSDGPLTLLPLVPMLTEFPDMTIVFRLISPIDLPSVAAELDICRPEAAAANAASTSLLGMPMAETRKTIRNEVAEAFTLSLPGRRRCLIIIVSLIKWFPFTCFILFQFVCVCAWELYSFAFCEEKGRNLDYCRHLFVLQFSQLLLILLSLY